MKEFEVINIEPSFKTVSLWGIPVKIWNPEADSGYQPISTFYLDFTIADRFGQMAVIDTYSRCLAAWKHDYKYLTELSMVLNYKIWEHYKTRPALAAQYNNLWDACCVFCTTHLKGEELQYFYETTDYQR